MEQMQYVSLSASEIKFFLTRLKNGDINDIKYRKMLITILVHSVYLYDDGRKMYVFNAGDKKVTVDTGQIDDFEGEFDKGGGSFLNNHAPPFSSLKSAILPYFSRLELLENVVLVFTWSLFLYQIFAYSFLFEKSNAFATALLILACAS